MFDGERYFYTDGKRLFNEYADGKIKIFFWVDETRTTEIDLGGTTISVIRESDPEIIPGTYGKILVPSGENTEILPIKRPTLEKPFF